MRITQAISIASRLCGFDHQSPPYMLHVRSSRPYIIATVSISVFTDLFLYGLIVAVLPFSLPQRVGISDSRVQSWISILLAAFAAACVLASPPIAWLSERTSTRRTPYLVGGCVLTAATLMLCLGRSIPVLIIARILQGSSAAVAWIAGPSLIVDTFGSSNDVGKAMGYVGLSSAMATVLGPLLGGVLYGAGGYYAPYGLAFAALGLDLLLRFFLIEQSVAAKFQTPPYQNSLESRTSDKANLDPDPSSPNPAVEEAQHKTSQEDCSALQSNSHSTLTLLKSPRLQTATLAILTVSIIFTSFDAVLALYVQETFHWTSTGAGLIYLPLMLPSLLAPLLGHWIDKYNTARWSVSLGFLIAITPAYICLRFVTRDTLGQVVLLCMLLGCVGLGVAASLTPTMTEMSFVVLGRNGCEEDDAARSDEKDLSPETDPGDDERPDSTRRKASVKEDSEESLPSEADEVGRAVRPAARDRTSTSSSITTEQKKEGSEGQQAQHDQKHQRQKHQHQRPQPKTGREKGITTVYSVFNAAYSIGNAVGPLWAGYVRDRFGWGNMAWSLGVFSGITGVVCLLWLGGPIWRVNSVRSFRFSKRPKELEVGSDA